MKRWETISIDTKISGTMPDADGVPRVTVVSASDHDRIVADLRIKIRSLNLEIETRAKPTVEKLKNEITNLKAEIVRLSRPVSAICTKCGYDKPANLYEQTIARQAKQLELAKILYHAAIKMVDRYSKEKSPFNQTVTVEDIMSGYDKELEAIEQGEGT